MDAKMANFIGIHMLNEMPVQKTENNNDLVDQQYQDPFTGCHFEFHDLVRRLN
jgi:hypothetical protein